MNRTGRGFLGQISELWHPIYAAVRQFVKLFDNGIPSVASR